MRFQISFPDAYPRLPPLVTFSTDMFHPLISPLSTYMYSTDVPTEGTVSATDDERLPPGGFSLRHGFPQWFGRRNRARAGTAQSNSTQRSVHTPPRQQARSNNGTPSSRASGSAVGESPGFADTKAMDVSTFEVLRYIRSTFDEEDVLDSVPLEAACNPGAWHAWRAYRQDNGKVYTQTTEGDGEAAAAPESEPAPEPAADPESKPLPKTPGEWNWEGVWEERVQKNLAASLSEPVLFGGAGAADDVVSLLSNDLIPIHMLTANRSGSRVWRNPRWRL